MRLRTVGHGALEAGRFAGILSQAGVTRIVDVRAYPGSRRHPHFGRDRLAEWLPEAGVAYVWEPRLGGRRKPGPGPSPHVALANEAFRAYADHMGTADFAAGVDALLGLAGNEEAGAVAVMCAESLWWRCHRRLVADALVLLHGVDVEHLHHDGRLDAHRPTEGVRMAQGPGGVRARLVYDAGVTGSLL
jgi:uncharacterized protein (DUF488 family)